VLQQRGCRAPERLFRAFPRRAEATPSRARYSAYAKPCYHRAMSDAADERRKKRAGWRTEVFRGPDALARLEDDALEEWAALSPEERAALAWQLSVEQSGGEDERAVESRLPRSAYRVERR
jgi:hypothetical protein